MNEDLKLEKKECFTFKGSTENKAKLHIAFSNNVFSEGKTTQTSSAELKNGFESILFDQRCVKVQSRSDMIWLIEGKFGTWKMLMVPDWTL